MKKFLVMMMCVIMVICFMPTVALAGVSDTDVVKIGDTGYQTIQAAINAEGNEKTVTLLKDVTENINIPSEKTVNLDLNGKTITATGTTILNNGRLIIKDSVGTGKVVSTGNVSVAVGDNSVTTIEAGTFEAVEGAVITGYATSATININEGTFNVSDNAVVAGNGNKTNSSSETRVNANTININGGTFNGGIKTGGYVACGIYAPWKDTINVTGGTFNITGGAGIVARAGNVTVSGGTFNTNGNATGKVGDSRVVVPCSAIVFDSEANYPALTDNSKISILGGTFASGEGVDAITIVKKSDDANNRVAVTGGTFSDLGVLSYLGEDADVTVKLNSDVAEGVTIPSGKTVNLDLNGKTITATGTTILNNGRLIIKDSVGTGKVVSTGNVSVAAGDNSVTTIEAGTFEAVEGAVITGYATGATININEGTFNVSDNAVVAGNGNKTNSSSETRVNANTININGGTFNGGIKTGGYVACGIYAPWKDTINVTGGTFNITGGAGIVARAGNVTVSGGTFNTNGNATGKVGDSRVVVPCSAIVFDSEANYPALTDASKISVTGGTFNSESGVSAITVIPVSDSNTRVAVTGGTFSSTPEQYLPANSRYYVSQEGGKYVVRYSTPYIPTTPATPTDNVTNSGSTAADNATTSADLSGSTSTSNGTTSATVDKTTADKIVDKVVENKSTEVVIDATANTTTAANSTTIAQVTIPTETLGAIAEKTEADVTIKTDVAEVKMDNAAAAAVSEQAEGDTVQIIAEKVAEEAGKVELELKVVCSDGKVISNFNGGNIAVTVALPKAMADKKVVCVYIDDNGHMSKVAGQKNADGTYTFNTGHFSSYAIMAEEEADAAIAAQKEAIKNIKIKLTSKQVKTKAGKKAVKITWTADAGDKVLDGVEVFRSTERYKGYGTEPFYTSTKGGNTGSYTNTKSLKKGTKYYYRVRGYVLVDGQKVYTDYSTKAWRTVK